MIFQELNDARRAVGRREHLARPPAEPRRHRLLAPGAPAGAPRPGAARRAAEPRRAGGVAAHRRAADRGDRPRAVRRGALPDPRRADRGALGPGGRAAVHVRAAPARAGRRARLHHAPARRGAGDRRPRASSCATATSCSRARPRTSGAASWSRRWSAAPSATCTGPSASSWPADSTPLLRYRGASSPVGGGFRDVEPRGPRRRGRRALRQARLGHRRGRRGRVRPAPPSSEGAIELDGAPVHARRAGAARSTRASACCRPTARATAPSWCARSPRTSPRRRGRGSRASTSFITAAHRGARVPPLARRAHDPLAQRPRAAARRRCRAATSRRCCSAAGWSATRGCSCSSSRPAASTSAPARRSTARSGSSPPRASRCSSRRLTTRRSSSSPTAPS